MSWNQICVDGAALRGYPSDVSDAAWRLIEPVLPAGRADGRGRPRTRALRTIVNAFLYLVKTGAQWRYLPSEFGPWQTVYWYFQNWSWLGVTDRIHEVLQDRVRQEAGRDPSPSAAIIDAQSVKGAETVGSASRGYDAGKKINGRKRHIVVDTMGLLLAVIVTTGNVQDRDGARPLLTYLTSAFPGIGLVWADGGYQGKLVTWADTALQIALEITRKIVDHTFKVIPRRWVVERTFAWITQHRRLARDYERKPTHSQTWIKWAMIAIMTRRIKN